MIRITSRFVRQAIVASALTVGVATASFAQNTSSASTTTTQATSTTQTLLGIFCMACTGGKRIQAE